MGLEANLLEKASLSATRERTATEASTGVDNDTSANVRNWMECVRSRKTPNASIEAGYSHSVALCMTCGASSRPPSRSLLESTQERSVLAAATGSR